MEYTDQQEQHPCGQFLVEAARLGQKLAKAPAGSLFTDDLSGLNHSLAQLVDLLRFPIYDSSEVAHFLAGMGLTETDIRILLLNETRILHSALSSLYVALVQQTEYRKRILIPAQPALLQFEAVIANQAETWIAESGATPDDDGVIRKYSHALPRQEQALAHHFSHLKWRLKQVSTCFGGSFEVLVRRPNYSELRRLGTALENKDADVEDYLQWLIENRLGKTIGQYGEEKTRLASYAWRQFVTPGRVAEELPFHDPTVLESVDDEKIIDHLKHSAFSVKTAQREDLRPNQAGGKPVYSCGVTDSDFKKYAGTVPMIFSDPMEMCFGDDNDSLLTGSSAERELAALHRRFENDPDTEAYWRGHFIEKKSEAEIQEDLNWDKSRLRQAKRLVHSAIRAAQKRHQAATTMGPNICLLSLCLHQALMKNIADDNQMTQ